MFNPIWLKPGEFHDQAEYQFRRLSFAGYTVRGEAVSSYLLKGGFFFFLSSRTQNQIRSQLLLPQSCTNINIDNNRTSERPVLPVVRQSCCCTFGLLAAESQTDWLWLLYHTAFVQYGIVYTWLNPTLCREPWVIWLASIFAQYLDMQRVVLNETSLLEIVCRLSWAEWCFMFSVSTHQVSQTECFV